VLGLRRGAAEAAHAAEVSQWGSELPPGFFEAVLDHAWTSIGLATYGAIRATCSTWSSIFDAWCPDQLEPQRWTAVMEGKMGCSVPEVNLMRCVEGVSG
jgi:hypothetical protein